MPTFHESDYSPKSRYRTPEETEAYDRVKRRFRRHRIFNFHLFLFVLINALGWGYIFTQFLWNPLNTITINSLVPVGALSLIWLVVIYFHQRYTHISDREDAELEHALNQARYGNQPDFYEEIIEEAPYRLMRDDDDHYYDDDFTRKVKRRSR